MSGKCVLCEFEHIDVIDDSDYCSVECARTDRLCARLKRIEDVLVEVKYSILKLDK